MSKTKAAEMAAEWWAERLQQGDRAVFKSTLKPLVQADLEEDGVCWLDVDYDPRGHVLTAVRAAGVECRGCMFSAEGILPMKHSLRVDATMLKPKEGYGHWSPAIPVPDDAP